MTPDAIEKVVFRLLEALADGEYATAIRKCSNSRLTADDLDRTISIYGRTIIKPPLHLFEHLDCVAIQGRADPAWSVRAPLWTLEEGRSDLTLELTVTEVNRSLFTEIDDLKVM
ncbi:DUF7668 domain-containing protein [Sphingomonas phyllosphaerae]|uniref:DUF7668 domain-containing protein n=1 Tax=Sphingomonas phyllosphaerae TaxID=257003 RepID=UPI0012DD840C|nr:hypothetical protein [Sphingomonas phyllosphaerae]